MMRKQAFQSKQLRSFTIAAIATLLLASLAQAAGEPAVFKEGDRVEYLDHAYNSPCDAQGCPFKKRYIDGKNCCLDPIDAADNEDCIKCAKTGRVRTQKWLPAKILHRQPGWYEAVLEEGNCRTCQGTCCKVQSEGTSCDSDCSDCCDKCRNTGKPIVPGHPSTNLRPLLSQEERKEADKEAAARTLRLENAELLQKAENDKAKIQELETANKTLIGTNENYKTQLDEALTQNKTLTDTNKKLQDNLDAADDRNFIDEDNLRAANQLLIRNSNQIAELYQNLERSEEANRNLKKQQQEGEANCRQLQARIEQLESDPKEEQEEKVEESDEDLCDICMDAEPTHAFVPCGHRCVCEGCSGKFRECPICRQRIQSVIKIFT